MKTINQTLLAGAIAAVLAAPAFATNGTNMTGVGAQSVAMGGTGVAAYYGSENVIVNPAMIGKGTGTEFVFGGTLFKPNVKNNGLGPGNNAYETSDGDTYMIPAISLSSRINNNWSFGLGMYGTSGMGVDYGSSSNPNLFRAMTSLQIMRIVPTVSYNTANAGIGFSPIIQYGALDINYQNMSGTVGSGMASDLGMGYSVGGYYDVTKQFTIGATYTSAIDMKYKNQMNSTTGAASGFRVTGISDNLEQPAEIKVGAAYTMGNIMLTGDFKQIRWSEAKGYKDFSWEDQNVIALGLKYSGKGYWLGVGYNKADNPIKSLAAANMMAPGQYQNGAVNMFNNVFFPAITEQHFSFGGGYDIT
ncbi:MAG TPA: outer membrane protein transport protein, partial [Thiotrichales bacterium]